MNINDNPKCFNNHMGLWLCESNWLSHTVRAIQAGYYAEEEPEKMSQVKNEDIEISGNIAVIRILGAMQKGFSKFGGASTVQIRREIRAAMESKDVDAIMLAIESPGGNVAGTKELGDEIARANQMKPVFAHIDDLGASAAYWVASQARMIFANEVAEIGSIGTMAIVWDTSEQFEREGVKVHVISTGDMKGAFADGQPVTKSMLADLQDRVDAINAFFLDAVEDGRGMDRKALEEIADGRVFIAEKALQLGLIDGIQSFEQSMSFVAGQITNSNNRKRASELADRIKMFVAEPKQV